MRAPRGEGEAGKSINGAPHLPGLHISVARAGTLAFTQGGTGSQHADPPWLPDLAFELTCCFTRAQPRPSHSISPLSPALGGEKDKRYSPISQMRKLRPRGRCDPNDWVRLGLEPVFLDPISSSFLDQPCLKELPMAMVVFYACIVRYGTHWPHVHRNTASAREDLFIHLIKCKEPPGASGYHIGQPTCLVLGTVSVQEFYKEIPVVL